MKMTEKMKQSLMEDMRKEGIELSDEQLDEVAGGRYMTYPEKRMYSRYSDCPSTEWKMYYMRIAYIRYITSLPEDSPEVYFKDFMRRDITVTLKCVHCNATVTASLQELRSQHQTCSMCGNIMYISDF